MGLVSACSIFLLDWCCRVSCLSQLIVALGVVRIEVEEIERFVERCFFFFGKCFVWMLLGMYLLCGYVHSILLLTSFFTITFRVYIHMASPNSSYFKELLR